MANARSRVIFQTSADDARVLARELAPYLEADDLRGLGPHEVVVTLATGARVAPPATGITLPPPAPTGVGPAARERSREQFGELGRTGGHAGSGKKPGSDVALCLLLPGSA